MSVSISRNARLGALSLAGGALIQLVAGLMGALAAPWAYAGWLLFCFGALCLCEELGAARPLNRAGLILMGAGFCARLLLLLVPDPAIAVRAEIAFAFTSMGMILFWSVALLHRPQQPKLVGMIGSLLSGGSLALLLAAHVAAAGMSYFGFAEAFAAIAHPEMNTQRAMLSISVVIAGWSLITATLLSTTDLNAKAA